VDHAGESRCAWPCLALRAGQSIYPGAGGRFQAEWTPHGWANAKDSLTVFEQLLYLRQPGYGSCYITGKMLADELITGYAHQQDLAGKPFVLRDFMDRFNNEGMIPIFLMESEMVPSSARTFGPQQ
jgi:hypothetical protein